MADLQKENKSTYISMDDYKSRDYKPFKKQRPDGTWYGRENHFCVDCKAYYRRLYEAGITKEPFMPRCFGDIRKSMPSMEELGIEDQAIYDEMTIVNDPIKWAEVFFGWKPRWYQEEMLACLKYDSNVFMADGTVRKICDIKTGEKVLTYDETGRRVYPKEVLRVIDQGTKPVYRIELENGDHVECTSDHRLYSWSKCGEVNPLLNCPSYKSSYKSIDDGLKVGDRLFVLNQLGPFGKDDNVQLAKLLGYIVTDGYVKIDDRHCLVEFSNIREQYIVEFEQLVKSLFPESQIKRRFKASHISSSGGIKQDTWWVTVRGRGIGLLKFLESIGCIGPKTRENSILEYAFGFSENALTSFINRCWAGDGCVYTSQCGIAHLTLHSGNVMFLEKFRFLLRKIAVQCSQVYEIGNYVDGNQGCCLHIQRVPDLLAFLDHVGPIYGKEEQSRLAIEKTAIRKDYGKRRRFGTTSRFKIKSIQLVGDFPVYDLSIKDRPNFFANGSVVHNCSAPWKVVRAGRRLGKTAAISVLALHHAFTNDHHTVLVVAPYQSQVAKIFQEMQKSIDTSDILKDSIELQHNSPPMKIVFKNGSILIGFASGKGQMQHSDQIRGQDADLIVLDEVDMMNDYDLETIMAILASHAHCQIWASSTPRGWRKKFWEWCFPPGTQIGTLDGYKSIEKFKAGDSILSASGHEEKVLEVYERDYSGYLYRVSCKKTFYEISSTPEHPHLIISQGSGKSKPVFVHAKDISCGDWIGVTIPKTGTGLLPQITGFNDPYTDLRFQDQTFDMRRFLRSGYDGCRDIRILKNIQRAQQEVNRINGDPSLRRSFMSLLGIYIAEGNIIKDRRGIQISTDVGEDLADTTIRLFNHLWPEVTVNRVLCSNDRGSWEQVKAYASWLPYLFISCGGEYSSEKRIHPDLLASEFMDDLFEHYWLGDGHKDKGGGKSITTTSRLLADQLWRYLLGSGINASLYTRLPCEGHKQSYTVYVLTKDTNQIRWYANMPFFQVKGITTTQYDGKVYNLQTNRSHTYSAEGFATHNCVKKNLRFKEFHYISPESPEWSSDIEEYFVGTTSKMGYMHEFLAEFGEEAFGVFKTADVDEALFDYKLSDITPAQVSGPCIMGVDWNLNSGTHICIVEWTGEQFKLVHKTVVPKSEFTQMSGVAKIKELNKLWDPRFIYVDEGYGSAQIEYLKSTGLEDPKTGLYNKLRPIMMARSIEITDRKTGEKVARQSKQFMVELTANRVENHQVMLPREEDTRIIVEPDDPDNAGVGLVQQMRDFRVVRESSTGQPIYSQDYEHTLTAFMLTILGFQMEFGGLKRTFYATTVKEGPRLGENKEKIESRSGDDTNPLSKRPVLPRAQSFSVRKEMPKIEKDGYYRIKGAGFSRLGGNAENHRQNRDSRFGRREGNRARRRRSW